MKKTLEERFWPKVNKSDDCWLWTASIDDSGYGRFHTVGMEWDRAHRVSWRIHYGEIPDGLRVLHRCDTPACVNPNHLFLGTQADNIADMVAKGRNVLSGLNNHKLTPEQVRQIRQDYIPYKVSRTKLAKRFNVHPDTIDRILRGITYRHIN